MKSFLRQFLRLQWKLTFSYTWITATTLFILTFASVVAGSEAAAAQFSQLAVSDLQAHVSELVPYVSATPPDRAGITHWLQQPGNLTEQVVLLNFPRITYFVTMDGSTVVVDRRGIALAALGPHAVSAGTLLEQHLPPQAITVLRAALKGQTDTRSLVISLSDGTAIVAYPLVGPYGRIEGALVAQTTDISQPSLLRNALLAALLVAIPAALLAAMIGTIFGFFTARGFSRRFKQLSFTVDQWGQGNFTALTQDASGDELGQLTQRLNHMAQQLQTLLHTHEELAILEERNRLARDLHDSVKQQVFAISMLVNSARGMLRGDIERAQSCLEETDASVQRVQQELTALVQALRPSALGEKGLVVAVRELATQWSRQSGIAIQVRVQGEASLSIMVEEALFRIVQEALANVARHSQATRVEIALTCKRDLFKLCIGDNGQGFEAVRVQGKGIGLLSMQERMRSLGGLLLVESVPGQGTHITACCSDSEQKEAEKGLTRWSRLPS